MFNLTIHYRNGATETFPAESFHAKPNGVALIETDKQFFRVDGNPAIVKVEISFDNAPKVG